MLTLPPLPPLALAIISLFPGRAISSGLLMVILPPLPFCSLLPELVVIKLPFCSKSLSLIAILTSPPLTDIASDKSKLLFNTNCDELIDTFPVSPTPVLVVEIAEVFLRSSEFLTLRLISPDLPLPLTWAIWSVPLIIKLLFNSMSRAEIEISRPLPFACLPTVLRIALASDRDNLPCVSMVIFPASPCPIVLLLKLEPVDLVELFKSGSRPAILISPVVLTSISPALPLPAT